MAFEDHVSSSVVDIRKDNPKSSDSLFVDTNVWYFYASSHSSLSPPYQKRIYPSYINKMSNVKSNILRCELNLVELSHVLEKELYNIFLAENTLTPDEVPLKDFRHNYPDERDNFVDELCMSWDSIKDISKSCDVLIDESVSKAIIKETLNSYLDGYDLIYLDLLRKTDRTLSILTDDRDFATVPDITVFTANNKVIDAAKKKNLLITR